MTRPAKDTVGCLIWSPVDNKYLFRVYTDSGEFTDYDIAHTDLQVMIVDDDACFYDTSSLLDHSPQTLGLDK